MSWAAAVVFIVAIIGMTEVFKAKYRGTHGTTITHPMGEGPFLPRREEIALRREVEELRERVKVLERIATEDRETKLLSAEIDRLREK